MKNSIFYALVLTICMLFPSEVYAQNVRPKPQQQNEKKNHQSSKAQTTQKSLSAQELYEKGNNYYWKNEIALAIKYFKQAAEKENASAMVMLGNIYKDGATGVPIDEKESFLWYKKAAEHGDIFGMEFTAVYLKSNAINDENLHEAMYWFRKAAEKGSCTAKFHIGEMYQYGLGVEEDMNEAIKWFKESAKEGCFGAETKLTLLGID